MPAPTPVEELLESWSRRPQRQILFEKTSLFQKVIVNQDDAGVRRLVVNDGLEVQSTWIPNQVLTGDYPDGVLLAPLLAGRTAPKVLLLGVGGGTIPRAFAKFYPRAHITGVEIDPVVIEAGRTWMGVGANPNLDIVEADGRAFLESTSSKFDLIIVDAYEEIFIPGNLATKEFYQLAAAHLNSDGVFVQNVCDISKGPLTRRLAGTLAHALNTFSWHFHRQNTLVFGFSSGVSKPDLQQWLGKVKSPLLQPLAEQMAEGIKSIPRSRTPITDATPARDWNPDQTQWGNLAQPDLAQPIIHSGRDLEK